MCSRPRRFLTGLLPFLIFLLLWQIVAFGVESLRAVPFPTPWQTFVRLGRLASGERLSDALLYRHLCDSLIRWFSGFALAAVCGLFYGLFAGLHYRLEVATGQIIHLLQLIPGLARIPVAILIFGIGASATVFMNAMAAFPPVAISVLAGVKHLDITYLRAARMLGAGKRVIFFHVLLPASLPAILSGLRVGMGNSWRVLLAAEMVVGTGTGLGFSIVESRWNLDYGSAFACLVIIAIIGLTVEYGIFQPIERSTLRRYLSGKDV